MGGRGLGTMSGEVFVRQGCISLILIAAALCAARAAHASFSADHRFAVIGPAECSGVGAVAVGAIPGAGLG